MDKAKIRDRVAVHVTDPSQVPALYQAGVRVFEVGLSEGNPLSIRKALGDLPGVTLIARAPRDLNLLRGEAMTSRSLEILQAHLAACKAAGISLYSIPLGDRDGVSRYDSIQVLSSCFRSLYERSTTERVTLLVENGREDDHADLGSLMDLCRGKSCGISLDMARAFETGERMGFRGFWAHSGLMEKVRVIRMTDTPTPWNRQTSGKVPFGTGAVPEDFFRQAVEFLSDDGFLVLDEGTEEELKAALRRLAELAA